MYCDKPIVGAGVVVYPHPDWRSMAGGMWLNGHKHPGCKEVDDSEYQRPSNSP